MADPTAVGSSPPPQPMSFAIMRNSHEALRNSIKLQQAALEAGDSAKFGSLWRDFQRAITVHMAMEDTAMFPLLDEVSGGAVSSAAIPGEHEEDRRLARAVEDALSSHPEALSDAWSAWRDGHLYHLEHEEAVMMPLTMKTADSPKGRSQVVHERLVTPADQLVDFPWYLGWCIKLLSDLGSVGQPANVAVRVFAWGLQHACSREQWERYAPVVKANCAPEIWAEMVEKFGIDGEGKIVDSRD